MNDIWIEKFRPSSFDEVVGQDIIVSRIKAMTEQENVPHMLFSGPPGVGKTTLALIIAKTLFKDSWRQNFLETNASSERGIDVIRETIKDFARTKPMGSNIPKIILLDEADALTRDAQNALRRTMEQYSENCRFILSANYSSKVIEPIQSRCVIFRFKPLNLEDVKKVIKKISKDEKLKINDNVIKLIYDVSEGDLRRVENILQSCAIINNEITENLVNEITASANPKDIKEILEFALNKDFIKARNKLLELMLKNGLSGIDIIKQIQKEILNLSVNDNKKLELIDKCGEIEFRLVEGSDDFVQLESFLAFMGK
ncbi:MAG: replication factor C small subunit, partial [Nanoarchaeota archaeon]